MKRLTIDLLLAGTLAVAPLAWGQDYDSEKLQNRNDTGTPRRTGPQPTTTQRNTPPYPGQDPAAPQRVPSDLPPPGIPTPSTASPTAPQLPSPRGSDNARGASGSRGNDSTTTSSERSGNQPTPAVTEDSPNGDLTLIQKVHIAHQQEIEMAQLAADKARSPRVKSYARTLVTDHKAMDRQLMSYAQRKGLRAQLEQTAANTNAGEGPPQKKPDMHARLLGETGAEFDWDFTATMVDDHDQAIQSVRSARDSAIDPQLRDLFGLAVPRLEKHRKAAQDLLAKHLKS